MRWYIHQPESVKFHKHHSVTKSPGLLGFDKKENKFSYVLFVDAVETMKGEVSVEVSPAH